MQGFRLAVAVAIAALAVLAIGATTASADPGNGNGAVVINDFGCFINVPPFFGTTTDSHTVVTPSGNTILVCHFDIANPTGQAFVATGFPCGTLIGTTSDSQFVLSASGEGTLTCHINGSS